ncbi:hypothetical protein LEN26_011280 [Aphanomyces euteiches]|nr:hypothetical protein LEN26_011280 [Aphanomyces euteiches]
MGDEDRVRETPPCFTGLDETHLVYVSKNHLSSSDVVAITVTTSKRLLPNTSLKRLAVAQPKMHLLPPAVPQSLPIPRPRMNKILHAERDAYMKKLHDDRGDRIKLETWAAVKIQSLFRGHRVRPKAKPAFAHDGRTNMMASIRKELHDMQQVLPSHANSKRSEPWRQDVRLRAADKRQAKHRKDRLHHAATVIQACVKRFLARVAFIHLMSRHVDEMVLWSAIVVQAGYRGYVARKRIAERLAQVQEASATKIQCLVRGILSRERAALLRLERHSNLGQDMQREETAAATTIQRLVRGCKGRKSTAFLRDGQRMLHVQRIADGHLDERKSIAHGQTLLLIDKGVLVVEPRPSLKAPLNINTTHLHREETAAKLKTIASGIETRHRKSYQGSRRYSGKAHVPLSLEASPLVADDARVRIDEVHAAEQRQLEARQSLALVLPKPERVEGVPSRSLLMAPPVVQSADSKFGMYAEQRPRSKRANGRPTSDTGERIVMNGPLHDVIDTNAAIKIQAMARGRIVRQARRKSTAMHLRSSPTCKKVDSRAKSMALPPR